LHSFDTNRDAPFSLIELTRVIELLTPRSGLAAGNEDGFATGP
jgi:hypothetical protein